MIQSPPLHRRRILAAAILAGLVLALWMALIAPVAGALHQALSAKAGAQLLLQAHEQHIKSEPAWKEAYARLMAANAGSMFIGEKDASLASARFQGDIKQSLEQYKARIGSIQSMPPAPEGDLARATVRATFTIPVKTLEGLLTALERKTPSVFLDNLVITAPPDGMADTDQAPLSVQCDFIAYLLAGPA
jgi:general secretion pathway protein M